jgi:hypothetical protein
MRWPSRRPFENCGLQKDQAIGVVEALREIDASELATKSDIREVEAKIETGVANLKVEIVRWLIVTQAALAGLVFAAIRFGR